jgi:hypothetical protein
MPATNTAVAAPGRLQWMTATVREVVEETPHARSLVLDVPGWPDHRPGQHVDVRLTAEDGYQAQRSYSIASGPETSGVTLTVERIDEGEVSPYRRLFRLDRCAWRTPVSGRGRLRRSATDGYAASSRGGEQLGTGGAALFLAQF